MDAADPFGDSKPTPAVVAKVSACVVCSLLTCLSLSRRSPHQPSICSVAADLMRSPRRPAQARAVRRRTRLRAARLAITIRLARARRIRSPASPQRQRALIRLAAAAASAHRCRPRRLAWAAAAARLGRARLARATRLAVARARRAAVRLALATLLVVAPTRLVLRRHSAHLSRVGDTERCAHGMRIMCALGSSAFGTDPFATAANPFGGSG
jgi:hypothetical protein